MEICTAFIVLLGLALILCVLCTVIGLIFSHLELRLIRLFLQVVESTDVKEKIPELLLLFGLQGFVGCILITWLFKFVQAVLLTFRALGEVIKCAI